MKKLTLPLPCALDDAEIKTMTLTMIEHEERVEQLKQEAKTVADSFKDRIAGQNADVKRLREAIKSQSRQKDVECAEIMLHAANDIVTIRLDTGKEVNRRRMTDEDKQGSLLPDQDGEVEETRILGLFELADMLTSAGLTLGRNLQPLWSLGVDKVKEAREWVLSYRAAPAGSEPAPPDWLKALEEESQKEVASERAFQIRVNTIKAVLQEQGIKMDESDIGALTAEQQDQILAWSDSLGNENPLPRPEFLSKYVDPDASIPFTKPELVRDDSAPVIHQLELADTGPETSESRPLCDPTIAEFAVDTNAPVNCPACLGKTAASNGHLDLSAEDLAVRLNSAGAEVTVEKVNGWSEEDRHSAEAWLVDTEKAIAESGDRKPLPEFFFREG